MKKINSIAYILVMMGILVPVTSFAGKVNMSGFADIIFVVSDGIAEGTSVIENKFFTTAELDFETRLNNQISARLDLDLNVAGEGESGRLEQTYFTWMSKGGVQLKGGLFNNPLGWEAEDAPDLYQITHGQLYDIWDDQTALEGNNITGIAVSGEVGPVILMGAFLNDLQNVNEENSVAVIVNLSPNKSLDIEAGVITQETGAESIIDANLTYKKRMFTLGVELMLGGKEIDSAQSVTANYKFNKDINGTVRFDLVDYEAEGIEATTSLTLAIAFKLHDNLSINGELRLNNDDNDPDDDGSIIRAEVVAIF